MHSDRSSGLSRFVRFLVFVAIVVGAIWGVRWWQHRPVALSRVAASPESFVGKSLWIVPSTVVEAEPVLGYPAVTLTDADGAEAVGVSEHALPISAWQTGLRVHPHFVSVFGESHLVLTPVRGKSMLDSMLGLMDVGMGGESEPPLAAARPAEVTGRVHRVLRFLGHDAIEVQQVSGELTDIVFREAAPAISAEVRVEGVDTPAFRFDGTAVRFVEAETVTLSVHSILDAPEQYAGRTVRVEGITGRGMSLGGRTAYELRGLKGGVLVVWSEGGQPVSERECVVTGEVGTTRALGRTVAVTMVEQEIAPLRGSDSAGSPLHPTVTVESEGTAESGPSDAPAK